MQAVRNVCVTSAPSYLDQCPSLREASLRLQATGFHTIHILAELPASLASLEVNITVGNLPVRVCRSNCFCHQLLVSVWKILGSFIELCDTTSDGKYASSLYCIVQPLLGKGSDSQLVVIIYVLHVA